MSTIYLRKKDNPYVYIADSVLLKRNDLFPCDASGNFLSTGSDSMESIDGEFAKAKEDLYNRAESLGIKNYKRMKLTTLIDKIVRVETNKTLGEKGIVNTGD